MSPPDNGCNEQTKQGKPHLNYYYWFWRRFFKGSAGSQANIPIDLTEHCVHSDIWEDETVENVKGTL